MITDLLNIIPLRLLESSDGKAEPARNQNVRKPIFKQVHVPAYHPLDREADSEVFDKYLSLTVPCGCHSVALF